MLVAVFILPLIVALGCLALNDAVPTRRLGQAAAATLLAGAAALLAVRFRSGLPLTLISQPWMLIESDPLLLDLRLDAANWVFVLLVLAGGGLALLALALAVPANVRGFGGLFAAALGALCFSAIGLANQSPALLPFAWSLVALLSFLALRASGALSGSDAPVVVLLAGLLGALVLVGAALLGSELPPGTPVALAAVICWLLLGLLAFGAPPLHGAWQDLAAAPAPLAGALLTLGLPLLGGSAWLGYLQAQRTSIPEGWRLVFTLLGLLALGACAAGALGATRLRRLLAWQLSAQLGLLLVCAGQGGVALALVAPALLLNAALAALLGFLAVAVIERRAGSDDLAEIVPSERLLWPGALLLLSAASSVGLPGVWGFWPRRWLLDALLGSAPWAVPLLLAGSTLLALASAAPLAAFWRSVAHRPGDPALASASAPNRMTIVGALAALPLLALGVAPQLAWYGWLGQLPGAAEPPLPGSLGLAGGGLAALALLSIPLLVRAGAPAAPAAEPDQPAALALPAALGESLAGLAWLAAAASAFVGGWQLLLRGSAALRRGLSLFEQRYYLAGLLIALILVLLLFIQ